MDLSWGLQVRKATTSTVLALISPTITTTISKSTTSCCVSSWRPRNPRRCGAPPLVVSAASKKGSGRGGNNDNDNEKDKNKDSLSSSSGGDASKGGSSSDGRKSNDTPLKSHDVSPGWREFRANMIEVEKAEANAHSEGEQAPEIKVKPLGRKWAHPLSVPENGCILVATEKLDGIRTFERTVVLLLNIGTRHPHEGPFGVVINRPLKIRQMRPNESSELAKTFADCSLHFGGPLDASTLLFRAGENMKHPGFEEVIPGLFFGSRNSLDEAARLVKNGVLKPNDFKIFVGYSGWELDQLREEIESKYWYVAACSLDLIHGASSDSSSENLWQEVLQLMGGQYSELSQKPKKDM